MNLKGVPVRVSLRFGGSMGLAGFRGSDKG